MFDVALTIGIDSTGAKEGADGALRALGRIEKSANALGRIGKTASRAATSSTNSIRRIGEAAADGFGQLSTQGLNAWQVVAEAAESSADRQVSAAERVSKAIQSAQKKSTVIAGFTGFSPAQDIAQAEANITFFGRLQRGRNLTSGDFTRARNLGVAGFDTGVSQGRLEQALQFQREALDVLLRRRELEGRADGGSVTAGKPFVVGERGPEIFVPASSGRILSNHSVSGLTVNIIVNGADDPSAVARDVIALINREAALGRPTLNVSAQQSRIRRGG